MRISFPTVRQVSEVARQAGEAALSLLYPASCANCKKEADSKLHLCSECFGSANPIRSPFCTRCSEPFLGDIEGEFRCSNCAGRRLHFACAVAPYAARGVVREMIHRFKYGKEHHLRHVLAEWMLAGFADARMKTPAVGALVPVPLHATRERERGFNQAAELAELAAKARKLPVHRVLRRTRYTVTQTQLDREGRMENLRGAFSVQEHSGVSGRHLLLIDDIFTTGSTVDECARTLRAAGAASVRVLTVARA